MTKDEAMLKLRDELLAVEQDRANGIECYTIDEVEKFLDEIIEQSEEGNDFMVEEKSVRILNFLYYNLLGITIEDIKNKSDEYIIKKCANRAYLDLCRTLKFTEEYKNNKVSFSECIINNIMIKKIKDLLDKFDPSVINTEKFDFDGWHNTLCEDINEEANKCKYLVSSDNNESFHYGQAQKWVNMTLKYMFFTERWSDCFENIKEVLHAPIDNYILEGIWNEKWEDVLKIVKREDIGCIDLEKKFDSDKFKPWSKWNQELYKKFIKCLRNKVKNQNLIEWETKTWLDVARDKSGSEE